MRKHKVTQRQLLRCLNLVQDNCMNPNGIWYGDSLNEFCRDLHNVELLETLQAEKAVSLTYIDSIESQNGQILYVAVGERAGILWYENSEKWKNRIFGFITGVLTTVIAEFFIQYTIQLLS